MDYTEKKLRRLNTYEGIIINVGLDRVSLPDGSEAFREIVEHPGGACILPVDGEGNAYCVRQYRYPIGEHLLEAPAGKLERGEDPLVCASLARRPASPPDASCRSARIIRPPAFRASGCIFILRSTSPAARRIPTRASSLIS